MGSLDDRGKPYYLDIQLETCLQEFEEDREGYWKKRTDGHDWGADGLRGYADQVASTLLRQTEDLVGPGPTSETFSNELRGYFKPTTDLKELLRTKLREERVPPVLEDFIESSAEGNRPPKDSLLALVWERFCISLAEDSVREHLVIRANRMLRLVGLVRETQPSETTLQYLRRVSRCYILGLDVECAILCRAAIEGALMKAVSDSEFKKLKMAPNSDGVFVLSKRIQAAWKLGILDGPGCEAARRVKDVAKEGVHFDPKLVNGIFSIVRDMLEVVGQVAGPKKRRK